MQSCLQDVGITRYKVSSRFACLLQFLPSTTPRLTQE